MIINLTSHDVDIYNISDCILNYGRFYLREEEDTGERPEPLRLYTAPKEPARATYSYKAAGVADGIVIFRWTAEEITGLPEPKTDTFYIVPKMLAQALPEREDLIFPWSVVLDAEDNVVGCIDFSRV
nr:MAG TPA: hypothetical protein [Caudoviricetes sp.]